ncbi:DNA-directed RNA polymerase III subunit C37 ASCRUDRAFT_77561 [Ascoidea rubescens DSM 1968]|uniref:Uncharacterized protein n=1 Tax=Ascoidea rubescens DSM 1968 TaxID=1344418 RepID=A0A1D2VAV2_9ASCO|nr:hypothetical protein ASCRUDRAFT_77561 [Ascoidea rubescens DSM 1968]ODV58824.1 hypothetical protein ASCRUDRAFT_77561 [Ascoidea rubescens DSM 1968]
MVEERQGLFVTEEDEESQLESLVNQIDPAIGEGGTDEAGYYEEEMEVDLHQELYDQVQFSGNREAMEEGEDYEVYYENEYKDDDDDDIDDPVIQEIAIFFNPLRVDPEEIEERRQMKEKKKKESEAQSIIVDESDEEKSGSNKSQEDGQDDGEQNQNFEEENFDLLSLEFKKLNVLQYPTKHSIKSFKHVYETRMKVNSELVELDIPINTEKFYNYQKGSQWNDLNYQTLGGKLEKSDGYYIGIIKDSGKESEKADSNTKGIVRDKEIVLTPIEKIAQLRPVFHYIDAENESRKQMERFADGGNNGSSNTQSGNNINVQIVQMSAKTNDENAPRLSGALKTFKKFSEEEFVSLDWYSDDLEESNETRKLLYHQPQRDEELGLIVNKEKKLVSNTTEAEYFELLINN